MMANVNLGALGNSRAHCVSEALLLGVELSGQIYENIYYSGYALLNWFI